MADFRFGLECDGIRDDVCDGIKSVYARFVVATPTTRYLLWRLRVILPTSPSMNQLLLHYVKRQYGHSILVRTRRRCVVLQNTRSHAGIRSIQDTYMFESPYTYPMYIGEVHSGAVSGDLPLKLKLSKKAWRRESYLHAPDS